MLRSRYSSTVRYQPWTDKVRFEVQISSSNSLFPTAELQPSKASANSKRRLAVPLAEFSLLKAQLRCSEAPWLHGWKSVFSWRMPIGCIPLRHIGRPPNDQIESIIAVRAKNPSVSGRYSAVISPFNGPCYLMWPGRALISLSLPNICCRSWVSTGAVHIVGRAPFKHQDLYRTLTTRLLGK